jgi:hypothetical protein
VTVVDGEMRINQAPAWIHPGNGEDLEEEHDGCEPGDGLDDAKSPCPRLTSRRCAHCWSDCSHKGGPPEPRNSHTRKTLFAMAESCPHSRLTLSKPFGEASN